MASSNGGTQRPQRQPPIWLRRLSSVREELRGLRFPGSAADAWRETAALSAASLQLLANELRKSLRHPTPAAVRAALGDFLTRASQAEIRRIARWRKERDDFFRR
jgi:hypothetical protein